MKPFWLYTDIRPALDRPDTFLTTTTYAAEPEPHRDLLHFPDLDPTYVPMLARTLRQLKLTSGIIPPLINLGLQEDRCFFAFSLGPLSTAPMPLPLRGPAREPFWELLREGLRDLHDQGFSYGHLATHTVARTDRGAPMLFDVTALRSVKTQAPEVDITAFNALRERHS